MKKRKFIFTIRLFVVVLLTSLICILPVTKIVAEEAEEITISTKEELIAFQQLISSNTTKKAYNAKLTADIDLNPGVTFTYDANTGLVTVEKDGKSYKMGTGMKKTEVGSFHPVYNNLCTQEDWDNNEIISEERRNELITEMNEKIEELKLVKWTPIGTNAKPFIGSFDGNNHTIDGLYINDNTIDDTGLIGVKGDYNYVPGTYDYGVVKNVTIGSHSLVIGYKLSNKGSTGAIVGRTQNDRITNCVNYATVVGKGSKSVANASCGLVAGIAGFINGEVKQCTNYGTIVSAESAGGIVGNIMGSSSDYGTVLYCKNYGNVYADTESIMGYAGGIAVNAGGVNLSYDFSGPIEACTNYGYVEGGYAGGITRRGARGVNIKYCANHGEVAATSSAAGIVEYIDRGDFYMEGCYNAGVISIIPFTGDETTSLLNRKYPIASCIYVSSNKATYHNIKNCYNDKNIYTLEDDSLFGENIEADNSFNVTTELFATGEVAYKMESNNKSGWRQILSTDIEGKAQETYPTTDGEARVYSRTHYCCHTDTKNKEAHKEIFYTNSYDDIIDKHTPNEQGICSHCGLDVRVPEFLLDVLPDAKVGKKVDITIKLNPEIPSGSSNIKAVISEEDDTSFEFSNGLTGKADYSGYSGYYYYISGVPTKEGTITFTLVAENQNGITKKTYTLKINPSDPFEITTDSKLNNATINLEYSIKLVCTVDYDITWNLEKGSSLPDGLTLGNDGSIFGTPTKAGKYTFTVVAKTGEETASKEFTIVVFNDVCDHKNMTKIEGSKATCKQDGILDYYYCNDCGRYFLDESGKEEVFDTNSLKTYTNHSDKDHDGKCDFCKKQMPVFKKVTSQSEIAYEETYIIVTKINNKYYALTSPTKQENYEYNEFMTLNEITSKPNGDFEFNSLENSNIVMVKAELPFKNEELDATMERFGLSAIINSNRYSFVTDTTANFIIYPNEPAKYGYTIMLNSSGEIVLKSVYQQWWNDSETNEKGVLRAFEFKNGNTNIKFMSFFEKSNYSETYKDANINEYPIYLYKMTNISSPTFISNDTDSKVNKGDLDLPDIIDLSNVSGISDAIDSEYLEKLIEEKVSGASNITAGMNATITAKNLEKENETIISLKYSVVPVITLTDESGKVIYEGIISDSNFNGNPITVKLYVGNMDSKQIIHYKEDGTKEYFYNEKNVDVKPGSKTFKYEEGFVTFTIDSFSDIEILSSIQPEEDNDNLSTLQILFIIIGSIIVLGGSAFVIVWFVIKKKRNVETNMNQINKE